MTIDHVVIYCSSIANRPLRTAKQSVAKRINE